MVTNEMLREAKDKADGPRTVEKGPGSLLERLDDGTPVAPVDLIEAPDLPQETKERLVRLYRRIKKMDAYELLGVTPDLDAATIKRAFGAASKDVGGQGLRSLRIDGDNVRTAWVGLAGASVGIGACMPQGPGTICAEYPDEIKIGGAHRERQRDRAAHAVSDDHRLL